MGNHKVAVVTAQAFPSELASNNRILAYSKGLVELGTQVEVLTLAGSKVPNGTTGGVKFQNLGNAGLRNGPITLMLSFLKIGGLLLINRYSHLILVSNNALLIIWLFFLCKLSNTIYIQEKSEFPFVLNYRGVLKKWFAGIYVKYIYRLFDGMIIMTEPLMDYFKPRTKKDCMLLLMPMTVDVSRFDNINKTDQYSNCITYCGYMGGNKDGVKNLIEAFSFIQNDFPELSLLLLGTANQEELIDIREFAEEVAPDRVIFAGQISRDDMPFYLKNSKILALARPESRQSLGGFPTKLGEYLSTKKPALVTAVGDIPKYLKHRGNAFVVAPDDNRLFAAELSYILRNYSEALDVAARGYQLTRNIFNYQQQAVSLKQYLTNFKR